MPYVIEVVPKKIYDDHVLEKIHSKAAGALYIFSGTWNMIHVLPHLLYVMRDV